MMRMPAPSIIVRLLGAGLVAMLAALWLWPREQPAPARVVTPATAVTPPPATLPRASRPTVVVAASAPARSPQEFPDTLCQQMAASLGSVPDAAQLQQRVAKAQAQAGAEVGAMLQQATNSGDLLVRASALFLDAEYQAQVAAQELASKYPDCGKDGNCEAQMRARVAAVRTKELNEIARLASNSRDPLVYATAFYACSAWNKAADGSDVFCQQISATQWAQRDPGNGVPWLFAAQAAALEKRPAELDNAMAQLSRVRFFDERRVGLPQLRNSLGWQQKNPFTQVALANLNTAVYRQREAVQYRVVNDWCNGAANDNNRRPVCDAVANRLAADTDSMIRSGIGALLGEALGWPREKVAQLTLEQHAILGMELNGFAPRQQPAIPAGPAAPMLKACFDKLYEARHTLQTMQYGDMDEARKQLANQPLSRAELAARFRASMAAEEAAASTPR